LGLRDSCRLGAENALPSRWCSDCQADHSLTLAETESCQQHETNIRNETL
jgi:hypothetical protein